MANPDDVVLKVDDAVVGYGKKRVIDGVSVAVRTGEVVALIGHNGAGKSTLLKAIFGLLPLQRGSLALNGRAVKAPSPRELLRAGIAYCPQGNRVFSDLTVQENLDLVREIVPDQQQLQESIARSLNYFPALKTRLRQRSGTLSGGEQQMVALATALATSPRLLLLDEPSVGLSPPLVTETLSRIGDICRTSRVAALIVEQKVRAVLKISDRVYVLRNGTVSFEGTAEELCDDTRLKEVYL